MVKHLGASKLSLGLAESETLAWGPKVIFFFLIPSLADWMTLYLHTWHELIKKYFTFLLWASPYDLLWTMTCGQKWHCHCASFKPWPLRSLIHLLVPSSVPPTQRELLLQPQNENVWKRSFPPVPTNPHVCSSRQSCLSLCQISDPSWAEHTWASQLRRAGPLCGVTYIWWTNAYCCEQPGSSFLLSQWIAMPGNRYLMHPWFQQSLGLRRYYLVHQ